MATPYVPWTRPWASTRSRNLSWTHMWCLVPGNASPERQDIVQCLPLGIPRHRGCCVLPQGACPRHMEPRCASIPIIIEFCGLRVEPNASFLSNQSNERHGCLLKHAFSLPWTRMLRNVPLMDTLVDSFGGVVPLHPTRHPRDARRREHTALLGRTVCTFDPAAGHAVHSCPLVRQRACIHAHATTKSADFHLTSMQGIPALLPNAYQRCSSGHRYHKRKRERRQWRCCFSQWCSYTPWINQASNAL